MCLPVLKLHTLWYSRWRHAPSDVGLQPAMKQKGEEEEELQTWSGTEQLALTVNS